MQNSKTKDVTVFLTVCIAAFLLLKFLHYMLLFILYLPGLIPTVAMLGIANKKNSGVGWEFLAFYLKPIAALWFVLWTLYYIFNLVPALLKAVEGS